MKNPHKIIASIVIIVFIGCISTKNQNLDYIPSYIENRLSFFDPNSSPWPDSNYTYSKWIRIPENIKITHETFKKVGYKRIIDYNYYWDWYNVDGQLTIRIDSLVKTYKQDSIKSKYYREFWNRRKFELNDSIVFEVLHEIDLILKGKTLNFDSKIVNDTLYRLLEIDLSADSLNLEIAMSNFDYLKSIGFHQSAYNILKERYAYYSIEWNVDELEKTLIRDTNNSCYVPWIKDNTK
jgi:hypothetical protein